MTGSQLTGSNCRHCGSRALVKAGRNASGSQRYVCKACGRCTTLHRKQTGYAKEIRHQAVKMYLEGYGLRQISRLLAVNHQTIANWIHGQNTAAHNSRHAGINRTIGSGLSRLNAGRERDDLPTARSWSRPELSILGQRTERKHR